MKIIKPSEYTAPAGFFDQAITGYVEEKNLWESEDIELRLDSLRRVFAGMAVPPICWCMSAAAGYRMKASGVTIPSLVGLGGLLIGVVAYVGMFLNHTKFNTNLWLYSIFTGGISAYVFYNCSDSASTKHKAADASFIIGYCYCVMTLYSLVSIHCPISLFDIKPGPGQLAYTFIIVSSVIMGMGEALTIRNYSTISEFLPHAIFCIVACIWITLSFISLCFAYGMFRRGHDSALVVYAYVWPIDIIYRIVQGTSRAFDEDW